MAGPAASAGPAADGWPPEHLLLAMPGDGQGLPAAAFDAWCAGHAGAAITLWVSGAWLHAFSAEPSLPLADAELADHARGVLAHYLGEAAAAAPLAVWASAAGRGACLLHGLDLAALQQSARQYRVRLRAVAPWWCGQLARALAASPALRQAADARLLVVEHQALTVLHLARGQVRQLTQHHLDAATEDALAEAWRALAAPGLGPGSEPGQGRAAGAEAGQAAEPGQSVQFAQSVESGQSGLSAQPVESGQSGQSAQPVESGQSAQPVQPAQAAPPSQPVRPGHAGHAGQPDRPLQGSSAPLVLAIGHGLQGRLVNPPWQALGRLDGGPLAGSPAQPPRAWWTAWHSAPDFLQPQRARQTRRAGWAAAALAGLVLAGAAWSALQAHSALQAAEQRLALAELPMPGPGSAGATQRVGSAGPADQRMAAGPAAPVAAAGAPRAIPVATPPAVPQHTRWLAHPWAQRLAAVESVDLPGLRWTVLDLAADRPQVHLAGRADDATDVLLAAQGLAARPGWAGLLTTSLRPLADGGVAFEWTGAGEAQVVATAGAVINPADGRSANRQGSDTAAAAGRGQTAGSVPPGRAPTR